MRDLERRIAQLESLVARYRGRKTLNEEEQERTDVIRKVGNSWRIRGRSVKYWPAHYKTRENAENALKAYWANKHECIFRSNKQIKFEDFSSESGKGLIRNIQHFLIKIFGHTLYFDHYTNKSVELYYKGDLIAELLYKDKTDEIVIIPNNITKAPVSFYDTSEYEIQDYLSDLIIGDV
jgi:hypothetical protein